MGLTQIRLSEVLHSCRFLKSLVSFPCSHYLANYRIGHFNLVLPVIHASGIINFNIILPPKYGSAKWRFLWRFSGKVIHTLLIYHVRATGICRLRQTSFDPFAIIIPQGKRRNYEALHYVQYTSTHQDAGCLDRQLSGSALSFG